MLLHRKRFINWALLYRAYRNDKTMYGKLEWQLKVQNQAFSFGLRPLERQQTSTVNILVGGIVLGRGILVERKLTATENDERQSPSFIWDGIERTQQSGCRFRRQGRMLYVYHDICADKLEAQRSRSSCAALLL
jgi:hypothetical protein